MEKSHLITPLFLSCHFSTIHWPSTGSVTAVCKILLYHIYETVPFFCEHTLLLLLFPLFLFTQWALAVMPFYCWMVRWLMSLSYRNRVSLLVFVVCFILHVSEMHLCAHIHTSVLGNQMAWCFRWLKPTVCGYYTNCWLVPWKALLCKVNCKAHISHIGLVYILDACWIK